MNPLLQKALRNSGGVPDLSKLTKPKADDPNGVATIPVVGTIEGKQRVLGQMALSRWVHWGWLEGTALATGVGRRDNKLNDDGEEIITPYDLRAVTITRDVDILKYYLKNEPDKVKQAKKELAEEEKKKKENEKTPSEPKNNNSAGYEADTASKKR